MLAGIAQRKPRNPVVLGGDVHCNYVADLHADPERPDTPVVASEFCGTSITSQGLRADIVRKIAEANPHIRLADSEHRGYTVLDFDRRRLEARLRVVESVKARESPVSTLATFVVEDGRGIA